MIPTSKINQLLKTHQPAFVNILGPTASGKTDLAFQLAEAKPFDLISVDSRQVYQQMDIVTGKDIPPDFKFHPNKLLSYYLAPAGFKLYATSLVPPDETFSFGTFLRLTADLVDQIAAAGRQIIFVGGTIHWFYRFLTLSFDQVFTPTNPKWRQKAKTLPLKDLQNLLAATFPKQVESINPSDWQNPRRLIRLYERFQFTPAAKDKKIIKKLKAFFSQKNLTIILNPPTSILRQRIHQRILKRIDQGALPETQKLIDAYPAGLPAFDTPGYRQIIDFLQNRIDYDQMLKTWFQAELKLVRQQKQWITSLKKRLPPQHFLEITKTG
ncbi:MAG: hypothetical protein GXP43_02720 [bacterium]|nr:hypothetical protein [bacterium]